TWTSLTNEFWNGFTVGVRGVAPTVVPESGSVALFVLGALPVAGMVIRRRLAK
ncbi:MAG: PEP-CTERM sorting domain-containing protein, partial [Fibrella sp.]|nr:PEP-CTERM sorting domain-containing protein [Armatimonadota bacterium]